MPHFQNGSYSEWDIIFSSFVLRQAPSDDLCFMAKFGWIIFSRFTLWNQHVFLSEEIRANLVAIFEKERQVGKEWKRYRTEEQEVWDPLINLLLCKQEARSSSWFFSYESWGKLHSNLWVLVSTSAPGQVWTCLLYTSDAADDPEIV